MNIKKINVSCVILAQNEEKNIERAIRSVRFCDEIILIDDYSEDKTADKARALGAVVYRRKLNNDFASQRNYGMEMARGLWILLIDADEQVTKELAHEIKKNIHDDSKSYINAYDMKRRDIFWGRELRYGEVGNMRLVRLLRKKSGLWKGAVHAKVNVSQKSNPSRRGEAETGVNPDSIGVKSLKSSFFHYPHQSIAEFLSEVNMYSSIRARELQKVGKTSSILSIIFYPFGKFILNYFFRLGFLDGSSGFVYAFMWSFYSFLVRSKRRLNDSSN